MLTLTNGTDSNEEGSLSQTFGKILAEPEFGEEIVISGLAGRYPESNNVHELRDNLFNKVDMATDNEKRWKRGHPEIPQKTGKIPNVEKCDSGYFGLHSLQATQMNPGFRVLFEVITEAIMDAGVHPKELEGTRTGLFVGACHSESQKTWFNDCLIPKGFAITGNERCVTINLISHLLRLKGPSVVCDTACSSSMYAFENAYKAIRLGQCETAIVAGVNLCLHPHTSLQFARMGVCSLEGVCRVFDNKGTGYVRSEAVCAVILQKLKVARRNYSTILHVKTNSDGFKNSGITFPSNELQKRLLLEFYRECDYVKPSQLSFLEAHGTGTKVGDPEELAAIDSVFAKGRQTPLLIGSVKSNLGHTEPVSGLVSISKILIAYETGYIAPNLYYTTPREGAKGLEEGRLKVVTEKTRLRENDALCGVSGFGFGGSNCHILLKRHIKGKIGHRDNFSRLVCVSGRNRKATDSMLDGVLANNCDIEQIRLLQEVFKINFENHPYRAYSLVKSSDEISRSHYLLGDLRPKKLLICFGNVEGALIQHLDEIVQSPIAQDTLKSIGKILKSKGIDLAKILKPPSDQKILSKILCSFALQMILADMIKACRIVPTKTYSSSKGDSISPFVCAYFCGRLNLNETTLCAYKIAAAAHSTTQKVSSVRSDLADLLRNNKEISNTLSDDLMNIFKLSRGVDNISPEISSLCKTFFLDNHVTELKAISKNDWYVLEVGNGDLTLTLPINESKTFKCYGSLDDILNSIGRLYLIGFNPQIQNLYPKIDFPVSRGTPMISPHIKWNHKRKWWVTSYEENDDIPTEEKQFKIDIDDPEYAYLTGHVIDGRTLVPAIAYLNMVWETFADIIRITPNMMTIVFEDCKFKRATAITKTNNIALSFSVIIQKVTGRFEVTEGDILVACGKVYHVPNSETILEHPNRDNGLDEDQFPHMVSKDIYKELNLRGYNYSGKFKALQSYNPRTQRGKVLWGDNWVSFIDSMLQLMILKEDTRALCVPTGIRKLTIDAQKHLKYVNTFSDKSIEATINNFTGILRSGYVEIRGLNASSVNKRKNQAIPVLEKYIFVPNVVCMSLQEAIRTNLQILLENDPHMKVKVVEVIDEITTNENQPLADQIYSILKDMPLIQSDITILSPLHLEVNNVKVENRKLLSETECSLVVGSKLLNKNNILQVAFSSIKNDGFILSREELDFQYTKDIMKQISVVTTISTNLEKLILFQKQKTYLDHTVIKISDMDEKLLWLPKLQAAVANSEHVLLIAEKEPLNGALGLIACLRREPGGQKVKLLYTRGSAPEFSVGLPFYRKQLEKNLAINVYINNQWGTYRHLLLNQNIQVEAEHSFMQFIRKGDLSSASWFQGYLTSNKKCNPENILVNIHYASVNFKDIMTATARINADDIIKDRVIQESGEQGIEYSGITQDGQRVAGIVTAGACASMVEMTKDLLWKIPENWTLEEAATVPAVYTTVIMGLIDRAKIRKGESVLIHSGTGGVGLAAIHIALYFGCTVYTTVGTVEKRKFLKDKFPELTDEYISNSRSLEFEQDIMRWTKGKGVDVVLNSLAEEKLLASARCLAQGGRFLEIGKYDMISNNELQLIILGKSASFCGIMADALYSEALRLKLLVQNLIDSGAVIPLPYTVFRKEETEAAYRYMTTGKHIGKVLIEIRNKHIDDEEPIKYPCIPRYYCDPEKSYIICGGLGGFGLELADWMVRRNCRKLVLVSRSGLKTGYQCYRIAIWESYGCTVEIATDDITTELGCLNLIRKANALGDVHGIFNLAAVLSDGIFENQTYESFTTSFRPKSKATQHLDTVSRLKCPHLRDFVVFSSVSCGRGNAGQTNYGTANSIMERICEKRSEEGYPAIAIQWGAVGDVGLVADMQEDLTEMAIGGMLQQKISCCLETLDILLKQSESPVVSSSVVAGKESRLGNSDSVVDAVATVLGITDLKSISLEASLSEIGMDSMTRVEIKQTLEREFDIFLTPKDITELTFSKLMEIQTKRENNKGGEDSNNQRNSVDNKLMILRFVPKNNNIPVILLKSEVTIKDMNKSVIIFPGIEGQVSIIEPLYKNLAATLIGIQFTNSQQKSTIDEMAKTLLPAVLERVSNNEPFNILAYSFGCSVALEVAKRLEEKGYKGTVVLIDGTPSFLKTLSLPLSGQDDHETQMKTIRHILSMVYPVTIFENEEVSLGKFHSLEAKLDYLHSILPPNPDYSSNELTDFMVSLYKKLKAIKAWNPDYQLKSKVYLFKPIQESITISDEITSLTKLCHEPVEVIRLDGDHSTILQNEELAKAINVCFDL